MISNTQILKALDTYYQLCSLKTKERQGWSQSKWNILSSRIESIAEHVFGSQQLAWVMYSESNLDIDIFKVISMLSLHETEEVIIGDITPFDKVSPEEKLNMGNIAVSNLLKTLSKKSLMISLIDEFNEKKTAEAQFAYLCDKLECDLQIKRYSDQGNCSIQNAGEQVLTDQRVQKIISDGATTVADIFIEYDKDKYENTVFAEVVTFLKQYSTK